MLKISSLARALAACGVAATLCGNALAADARSAELAATPATTLEGVAPPQIQARNWLVFDLTSGQLLAAQGAAQEQAPASLTKLMTAYLSFKALQDGTLKRDQKLTEPDAAWRTGGSRMFIDPRTPVSVDDLLYGLIVQSGNDAAMTLALSVAGSAPAFVDRMNRQAQEWGLSETHFMDPTGLPDPGHHSSARDLAVIASHIIDDFPADFARYFKVKEFTYNRITQPNRVGLLFTDPSVDGMKTGYTKDAGYCMITTAQRAFPNGPRRLLAVVLGTASERARIAESGRLLNWAFLNFDDIRLAAPGQAVTTVPVWKGATDQLRLGSPRGLAVSVPHGAGARLKTTLQRTDPLVAPIEPGQQLGTLQISLDGRPIATEPLLALDPVPRAGVFKRIWDSIRLWIK
jgi:D-alanyl-D-alanine carboxypeptidase (penicillin-binding protein 5/6)